MAVLRVPDEGRTITDAGEVTTFLAERGIEYERTGVLNRFTIHFALRPEE